MTNIEFKRLTRPGVLAAVPVKHIFQFFQQFDAILKESGVPVPSYMAGTEEYYKAWIAILRRPETLPDPFAEALLAIEDLAAPENRSRLEAEVNKARPTCVWLDPKDLPECQALQLWLIAHPVQEAPTGRFSRNTKPRPRVRTGEKFGAWPVDPPFPDLPPAAEEHSSVSTLDSNAWANPEPQPPAAALPSASFQNPIEAGSAVSVAEPLADRTAAAPTVPANQPSTPQPSTDAPQPPTNPIIALRQPPPLAHRLPLAHRGSPRPSDGRGVRGEGLGEGSTVRATGSGEGPGPGATLGELQPLAAPECSEGGSTPQPSTKFNRHTGKIGRLPHDVRESINLMMHDNVPYRIMIERLGDFGKGLKPYHLSRWRKGGYQEWLKLREREDRTRAKQQFALDVLREQDSGKLHEASLQIASSHLGEFLADFDSTILREKLQADPLNFVRLLNALSKLSESGIKCEAHRVEMAERQLSLEKDKVDPADRCITPETIHQIEQMLRLR